MGDEQWGALELLIRMTSHTHVWEVVAQATSSTHTLVMREHALDIGQWTTDMMTVEETC